MREPVARRRWSLVARGLRTYLIQVAEDDGTLLKDCADPLELATALSAHEQERELVWIAINGLLQDGFLRWDGAGDKPGWLGVDGLVTFLGEEPAHVDSASAPAPAGETPSERRRRLARDRQRRSREKGRDRPRDPGPVTGVTEERDQRDLPPQSPPSEKEINKNSGGARVSGPRDGERDGQRVNSVTGSEGNGHIQPQLEHRRFAEQHGLKLDDFLTRLRRDPRAKNLSTVEAWEVLTRMLERAAGKSERMGGAA